MGYLVAGGREVAWVVAVEGYLVAGGVEVGEEVGEGVGLLEVRLIRAE